MTHRISGSLLLASLAAVSAAPVLPSYRQSLLPSLEAVRKVASMVPGDAPVSLHMLKYAESSLPASAFIEGGGTSPMIGAFTVFQIEFRDGWITVDAGHDAEIDKTFASQAGHRFWQEGYESIEHALRDSKLNVVTHEHPDHAGGLLRSEFADQVLPKTVLTREQVQSLEDRPSIPLMRLAANAKHRYRIIAYKSLYPLASGVVLISAPGHSRGSQMIYVRLASGKEAIFIGDIVYSMTAIGLRRQKPETTSQALGEDRSNLQQQIDWLHEVAAKGIDLIPCHDDVWLDTLLRRGVLREGLLATRSTTSRK